MFNSELLRDKIQGSGLKIGYIAEESGILRNTLYNKMKGKSEFTASEIVSLSQTLKLSRSEVDSIFFDQRLNLRKH